MQATGSSGAPALAPVANEPGAMMRVAGREQEIRVSEQRCTPREVVVQAGGRVTIRVLGGPAQAFSIGRDIEEAFTTPAISPGSAFEWWVLPRHQPAACCRLVCSPSADLVRMCAAVRPCCMHLSCITASCQC